MSVVQLNDYQAGVNNNLTSAVNCIDYGRLGLDNSRVEYSGGQFVLKVGSMVECNGNLYTVTGSDIGLGTTTGAVLTFNSSTLTFALGSGAAPYDATKAGNYISATVRALKWFCYGSKTYTKGDTLVYGTDFGANLITPGGVDKIHIEMIGAGGTTQYSNATIGGGGGGSGAWFVGDKSIVPGSLNAVTPSIGSISFLGIVCGYGQDSTSQTGGAGGVGSGGAVNGASGGDGGSAGVAAKNGEASAGFNFSTGDDSGINRGAYITGGDGGGIAGGGGGGGSGGAGASSGSIFSPGAGGRGGGAGGSGANSSNGNAGGSYYLKVIFL